MKNTLLSNIQTDSLLGSINKKALGNMYFLKAD